jgi:dTDP-4-dehydrorhamnose reductase
VRWIVTGSGGQLGRCLTEALQSRSEETLVRGYDRGELDIGLPGILASRVEGWREDPPDVVVNAAAFTQVDACEDEETLARRINGLAPGQLAEECRTAGVEFIHVSTDYVFDGKSDRPYDEKSAVAPQTAYGRSKLEGEERTLEALPEALIIRTSWVFGPGRNFVISILDQARKRRRREVEGPLRVVSDQRGSPTYAADLAEGIIDLAVGILDRRGAGGRGLPGPEGSRGIFHLANRGECSWFDFAREILDRSGHGDLDVERLNSETLDLAAKRPASSVLDCARAASLGVGLRPWQEALAAYLETQPIEMAMGEA